MEKLRAVLSNVQIPQGGDKVYKDECILSFDNPESETGLYICLNTFLGLGRNVVEEYSQKTNNKLFLHIHQIKKELPPEKEIEPEKKIARLAIGVEGGFNPDAGKKKYHIEECQQVVLLPDFDIFPYPKEELPELVRQSVASILRAESALHLAEIEAAAQSWDGEVRQVTRHVHTLYQLDNGVKVPPCGWKCARCDKTANLWMNLTDGTILCGRRQLDGSGGNNHAIEHYQKTGYPLAVKMGTITSEGKADVYSYDEDEMVIDPNLVTHLAKFGINAAKMEKTEKTMFELEIDYNQRAWEWSRLTEAGGRLTPKFGPGYTVSRFGTTRIRPPTTAVIAGLRNLGNSCYMNSVVQVLLSVPSFVERFFSQRSDILKGVNYSQAPQDFNVQMSKFADGILSGRYSKPVESSSAEDITPPEVDGESPQQGLSPAMFRSLVGKGHPEFSTKKQQDAMEFLEHLLKLTARNAVTSFDAGHCFKFEVEDKFICSQSGKVRYVNRSDLYLPLPVPLEEATNKEEVGSYLARKAEAQAQNVPLRGKEQVHSKIPFETCLSKLIAPEEITAFSSAVNREVPMQKVTRLTTFPDYLFIQLVKFGLSTDWQPVKYDVSIDMPDILDLSTLKGYGLQPGEKLMPDTTATATAAQDAVDQGGEVNEAVVQQLVEMGFPAEACWKAVHLTGNWGTEAAMNWIMENIDEPDFADSLPAASAPARGDIGSGASSFASFIPDEEGLAMLGSMGFTSEQARLALRETGNNLERAADWIFSHQPQLDALVAAERGADLTEGGALPETPFTDGQPKYELMAFISHMGTSIFVGHYVCHIKKSGEWIIFNDEKVYKSEAPPKDLGYIYLYRRIQE